MTNRVKDGRMSHPLYWTHRSMLKRCNNPNVTGYLYYGGRGIKVCDRWVGLRGFDYFLEDMGTRPEGYTLDRINPNGDYEPSNCRWADSLTQSRNKRPRLNSKTGVSGVSWDKKLSKWKSRIKVNKKEINLGVFVELDKAIQVRQKAEREYWAVPM